MRRPRLLAYYMAAETLNDAAGVHATGASSAIGHGGTLVYVRAAVQIYPLKAARCANPVASSSVKASGNTMRGVELPASVANVVRRLPMAARAANAAPGVRPNTQEKGRRMQGTASSTLNGEHEGFVQTAAHHPRTRRDVLRVPAGPGRVRASIAVCRSCHRNSRSSRLLPEQITAHGKTWLRWWLAWPSPGFPPLRSRS